MVLDGGPCAVGIESTVLDLTDAPRILRPGSISREALESALGCSVAVGAGAERRSPGMYARHYAPRTPLRIVEDLGTRPGLVFRAPGEGQECLGPDPAVAMQGLYAALHRWDARGLPEIEVEAPPACEAWQAVRDRLTRAST